MVPLVAALGLIIGWQLAGSDDGEHVVSAAERAAIELEAAWPGGFGTLAADPLVDGAVGIELSLRHSRDQFVEAVLAAGMVDQLR
jgi:hypothetical protein